MRAMSVQVKHVREEAERGVLRRADQQTSVEQRVHLLATRLRQECASVAGGAIETVCSLCVGFDADGVSRTPGRAYDRGPEGVFKTRGFPLCDQAAEASRRVGGRRIHEE